MTVKFLFRLHSPEE